MNMKLAHSSAASLAWRMVQNLQIRFVDKLENISLQFDQPVKFKKTDWLRDEGEFGGGYRYTNGDNATYNRAAVNISQVHYENDPQKPLNSATALSTIIHPDNPLTPSVHMHFSFTELKNDTGYWRLMADLNPAVENKTNTKTFITCLKDSSGKHFNNGANQGDKYFSIPVLEQTRGVAHFYLENFKTNNPNADAKFSEKFAVSMIDCYIDILSNALQSHPDYNEDDKLLQLDYHTLYLFQVLTLDRGTTSGLLVHNQNDVGIMGSIPKRINRKLLSSWVAKMPKPQDKLVNAILNAMPNQSVVEINDQVKQNFANAVRQHYQDHPEALKMQAKGDIIPPTVVNHK